MTPLAEVVLLELDAPPRTPVSAAELAEILVDAFTPAQIGQALRELRVLGRAVPVDARTGDELELVPAGVRVLWRPV